MLVFSVIIGMALFLFLDDYQDKEPPCYVRKNRWTCRNPIKRLQEILQRKGLEDMIQELEWLRNRSCSRMDEKEREALNLDWDNLGLQALDCAEDFYDVCRIWAYTRVGSKARMIAFEAKNKNKKGWAAPYKR